MHCQCLIQNIFKVWTKLRQYILAYQSLLISFHIHKAPFSLFLRATGKLPSSPRGAWKLTISLYSGTYDITTMFQ